MFFLFLEVLVSWPMMRNALEYSLALSGGTSVPTSALKKLESHGMKPPSLICGLQIFWSSPSIISQLT